MSNSPANTNDCDEVEPRFVATVALVALAIHLTCGPWTYGPYAVIVFFGCWRRAVSGSGKGSDSQKRRHSGAPNLRKWSASSWWKHVKWRLLVAVVLLGISFWAGSR
jgi:hypothetical protein